MVSLSMFSRLDGRPFGRRPLPSSAGLSLGLFLLACRPPASVDQPGTGETAPSPVAVALAPEKAVPAAEHALDLLAGDTPALMEVPSPARLWTTLGVPSVLTHPMAGALVGGMLDAESRAIVEDPQRLRDIGIDPDGSAGFALVDPRAEAIVFWVTTSEERKALEFLETRGGATLNWRSTAAGRIAHLGEREDLIVRDGILAFVRVGRPERASFDIARRVADADPRDGLRRSERWTNAFEATTRTVSDPAVVRAFVSPPAFLALAREDIEARRSDDEGLQRLREEIEYARNAGAPAEEVRMLEEELANSEAYAQASQIRRQRELGAAERLLGAIESLAFEMRGRQGVFETQMVARMPEPGSLMHRLLRPIGKPSTILAAVDGTPLFVGEGAIDPTAFEELVELLIAADGKSLDELDADMKKREGLSLRDDFLRQLGGEGGAAVYAAKPLRFDGSEPLARQLDYLGYVEIRDEARLRTLLDNLAKRQDELSRGGKKDHWRLEPGRNDPVFHLVLDGKRLVVATDLRAVARVGRPGNGGAAAKLNPAAAVEAFERENFAGRAWIDSASAVVMSASTPWVRNVEDFEARFGHYRGLSPAQVGKIKASGAYKKKLSALAKLYRRANAATEKRAAERLERDYAQARRLGTNTLTAEVGPQSVTMTHRFHFEGDNLIAMTLDAINESTQAARGPNGDDEQDIAELEQKIYELEYEIEQLRYRELDKWIDANPRELGPAWGPEP